MLPSAPVTPWLKNMPHFLRPSSVQRPASVRRNAINDASVHQYGYALTLAFFILVNIGQLICLQHERSSVKPLSLKTIVMARSKNNIAIDGLRGQLGQLVFRQWFGQTIVCRKPNHPGTFTPGQKAAQAMFRAASIYATAVMNDPVMVEFYRSKMRPGQNLRNLAIADYCKPPVVGDIDLSNYNGAAGKPIRVMVTDNGRVIAVRFSIENRSGLMETGNATMEADGMHWLYDTTSINSDPGSSVITITAIDAAGRETVVKTNV